MTSMEHEAIKLGPGHNPQDLELEEGEVSRSVFLRQEGHTVVGDARRVEGRIFVEKFCSK